MLRMQSPKHINMQRTGIKVTPIILEAAILSHFHLLLKMFHSQPCIYSATEMYPGIYSPNCGWFHTMYTCFIFHLHIRISYLPSSSYF